MIGKTFSHYTIIEKLGEGGMGVVYKAQDTKLKRNVALKFLPPELTRDPEAKERFIHEARAASALDHSNICTIHEINETEDGRMFIAMACYEGETLKERISRGPLELDEAVELAMGVAQGLSKAHAEEIVHRDIKPANIHITNDAQVKILDFGLAKLAGQTKLTKTGTTLGTVAYMSPEQARGEEIDGRADIWSLGAILYEMVTGQLPFRSEHEHAVLYSILNEDPEPVGALRPEIPAELARVIGKALAKNREERYQRVEDLVADLKGEHDRTSTLGAALPARESFISRKAVFLMAVIAAAMVLTIIVTVLMVNREPARHSVPTRTQLTFVGKVADCAISPDGTYIAYFENEDNEWNRVMVQEMAGGQPIEVFGERSIGDVKWSPDSKELLVTAGNDSTFGSYIVPRPGGAHRRYLSPLTFCCWSPDGSKFATGGILKYIQVVDREVGADSLVAVDGPFDWINSISWSPTGEFLAISTAGSQGAGIWLLREDGSDLIQLIDGQPYPVSWSSQGDAIYYLRSTGEVYDLVKLPVDPVSGEARGEPVLLLSDVDAPFTITDDCGMLLHLQKMIWSNLWLVDLDGVGQDDDLAGKELSSGTSYIMTPSVSPDGRLLAFSKSVGEQTHVFTMPVDGGAMTQLTHGTGVNGSPVWSPDGKQIAFVAIEGDEHRLSVVDAGGGVPRAFSEKQVSWDLDWAPADRILYQQPGNRNFHILDPESEKELPLPLGGGQGWMFDAKNSPDGKRVAICWNCYHPKVEMELQSLWVINLEDSSQVHVSPMDLWPVGWSPDGQWIYAMVSDSPVFCRVPSGGGKVDTLAVLPFDDIGEVAISPGARKLICTREQWQSDVWLIENFDPNVE